MEELVRFVTFRPLEGREGELRELITNQALEINRRFGALRIWCLSGDEGMAIVSVWARPDDLDTMRADGEYIALLAEIRARSRDLTDRRYRLIAGSSP